MVEPTGGLVSRKGRDAEGDSAGPPLRVGMEHGDVSTIRRHALLVNVANRSSERQTMLWVLQ